MNRKTDLVNFSPCDHESEILFHEKKPHPKFPTAPQNQILRVVRTDGHDIDNVTEPISKIRGLEDIIRKFGFRNQRKRSFINLPWFEQETKL